MKFVSRYRKLRVVLIPTRRRFLKEGSQDEVLVIPPVLAEFEGGIFDTARAFPILQKVQDDAGFPERLESEEKLIHLLKGHPDFGKAYSELYEESPEEKISKAKAEVERLEKLYGMSAEDIASMPENKTDEMPPDTKESNTHSPAKLQSRVAYEKLSYRELQKVASEITGITSVGRSREELLDILEESYLQSINDKG